MYNSNTETLRLILGVEVFSSLGHCSGALCEALYSKIQVDRSYSISKTFLMTGKMSIGVITYAGGGDVPQQLTHQLYGQFSYITLLDYYSCFMIVHNTVQT